MTISHVDDESNEVIMQMSYCNNAMIRKTECQNGHDVSTAKDFFKGFSYVLKKGKLICRYLLVNCLGQEAGSLLQGKR